jgi:hypothetical protein
MTLHIVCIYFFAFGTYLRTLLCFFFLGMLLQQHIFLDKVLEMFVDSLKNN